MSDLAAAVRSPASLTLVDVMVLVHLPVAMLYALEWASAGLQLSASRCYAVQGTENFDHVWRMRNPADCWRRWQTTLGAWVQDYAFKPLMRRTRSASAAIVLAFVYCGLLHGPQWRCFVWGLYNGVSVAAASWWLRRRRGASGPKPIALRILIEVAGRATLLIWISVGMTILIDPDGCGLPLLRRYVALLATALGIGA
jgi:D-alanyl-lipoteichoic acid acyltransferase DltB (MBOAT superfamily)